MSQRGTPLRPEDPTHIGAYELVGRLGAGGMGVVYEARARNGRPVAVKVVHADLAGNLEFRGRFRSEVARARQVPPFCTAEVLDADPEAAQPYLVVEFVNGPSLAEDVARHGPLSPANLHGLAIGVATALAAIHDAGVIHRDLKPHNVLLAPGSPKVIDFGIARALDPTTQHTRTGQVVGTINYMAPERFDAPGSPLTPAADVFAWGCVVAYAGQGRAPFDAESPVAIFARIMNGRPTLDLPPGPLRTLVQRALAASPELRPTARELVEALLDPGTDRTAMLNDVFERQPEMRRAVHQMRTRPGRRKRGSTLLVAAVATLALALTTGIGLAIRTKDQPGPGPGPGPGPSSASAARSMVLPSGVLELSDSLAGDGGWEKSQVEGNKTFCRYTDDRLQIQNLQTGVRLCAGPDLALKGSFAVEVTGRIELAGSCLGVWFAETDQKRYRLDACANTWQLQAEEQASGDSVVVHHWATRSTAVGQPIRLQVIVRDSTVRVGHDGILVGEQTLPERLTGGHFDLGVVSEEADQRGPFRASFNDVEVRIIT